MVNIEQELFHRHRHLTFIGISSLLSLVSQSATPGLVPIILTLATLITYSRIIFPSFAPEKSRRVAYLWASLTVFGSIPRLSASLDALSKPAVSVITLLLLSGITSAISIGAVWTDTKLNSYLKSETAVKVFLFPAIWSTLWTTVAYLSPLGMLSTWTPVEGVGAYDYLVPMFGTESLNWIAAAWAVVLSQVFMSWYMGPNDDLKLVSVNEDLESHAIQSHPTTRAGSGFMNNDKTALLAMGLILLTIPSYFTQSLPVPIEDITVATPLTVGCALPTFDRYKHHEPTFQDYLEETKKLAPLAHVILWPEGAVRFTSEKERDEALTKVRLSIGARAYVGVSFEGTFADPSDPSGRTGTRRTAIAIISNRTATPHLVYYKQHLVPIAESYSLSHSVEPPTAFVADIPPPKSIAKTKWAPAPDYTRPLPITSAICLDFSAPGLFEHLDVKPGLILAPARTWDVTVGYTMWKQASQRAREIGSTLVWCDGGAGGVSGIAGRGIGEVYQIGSGSWVRTVGLEYPFNDHRTLYARSGSSALLLFWALVVGSPMVHVLTKLGWRGSARRILSRRRAVNGAPAVDLLTADE